MKLQHTSGTTMLGVIAIVSVMGVSTLDSNTPPGRLLTGLAPQDTVSFSQQVKPILDRACLKCHGGVGDDGEVVVEEGLDMTTYEKLMAGSLYGTVVEPGDADGSYLVELIVAGDMPKEGDALQPEEVAIIKQWIAEGAKKN